MQIQRWLLALFAGGFSLATTSLFAAQEVDQITPPKTLKGYEESKDQIAPLSQENRAQTGTPVLTSNFKASALLGMPVRNESGERLGKLQDIIVSFETRAATFAIIERGGALGIGATRVAVPLADLKCSADRTQLMISATKELFDAASTSPTGGWMAVSGEDWAKGIDRFYGQPGAVNASRYERQETTDPNQGREPVRNAQPDLTAPNGQPEQPLADPEAKHQVATPTDEYIMGKINGIIRQDVGDASRDVQVVLKNGVVTLKGKVPSEAQRKLLENQIKGLGGVNRVQNNLTVSPGY